jgi:glycosyltransferase involved in cell wall biosynthesis
LSAVTDAKLDSSLQGRGVLGLDQDDPQGSRPILAVVVPCYDEELIIGHTLTKLTELLADLIRRRKIDSASFIYPVDDGSRDQTWAIIQDHHARSSMVKGLKLARNVGTQNALLAGLLGVLNRADCVVTIDADLQQDEHIIETFLDAYRDGAQIVYGVRRNHGSDSIAKRATSFFFYSLMNLMGVRLTRHHSEYRLVSRKALAAIAEYREYNLFLRGIFVDIGFPSVAVPFDVRRREAGNSKHSFRKLFSLALDGITSFSVAPLRVVTTVGVLIFLFSCAMTLFYLYEKLIGNTPPGWAGTVIPIYFLGGVQIVFLGLVGEYIGKIYKEVKGRPRYIKDEELS